MTTWVERAKRHFLQKAQVGAPITPEMAVMGVLGVASRRIPENARGVLGVLVVDDAPIRKEKPASDTRLLDSLLAAAMRCCDHYGDDEDARKQMREECLATPPHLQAELLAYFKQNYGAGQ